MSTPTRTQARPCPGCGEPLGPRTANKHRGCAPATSKPTPTGRPRPRLYDSCRVPLGLSLIVGSLGAGSSVFTDALIHEAGGTVAGLLTTGLLVHSARLNRWTHRHEHDRVAARLRTVAGQDAEVRTRDRDGHTPVAVDVTPGLSFPCDPPSVDRLRGALAAAISVEPWQVRVDSARGVYRLRRDLDARPPHVLDQPRHVLDLPSTEDVDDSATTPTAAAARVQEALAAALDDTDAEVQVLEWAGARPTSLLLTYPPRVAPKAQERRADLIATMHALHHPTGDWFVHWQPDRDRYLIEDTPDPLAVPVALRPIDPDPDLYRGVDIGLTENGEPWLIPLAGGFHTLVAGATGAGKGSVLWSIIRALTPMIRDGRVRLWIADPKGGVEFHMAEEFAYRFAVSQEDIAAMFTEAAEVMGRKAAAQRGKGRKIEAPSRETPLDLVIIDEIAAVVGEAAAPQTARSATGPLTAMLTQGRAPLFTVLAAVQDPRKENLRLRGLFTLKIALRLSEPGEVNLVLGTGHRAKGATADLINADPDEGAGIGFMVRDAKAGAQRARASKVTDEHIEQIAASLRPQRAPEHTPAPVVLEQLPLDEPVRPGTVGDLTDGCRFLFDGESIPATIVGDPEKDDDDRTITYFYDDSPSVHREMQTDRADPVSLLS